MEWNGSSYNRFDIGGKTLNFVPYNFVKVYILEYVYIPLTGAPSMISYLAICSFSV